MDVSQSNIVLVMDKRSQANAIAPYAAKRWPGRQVFVVFTLYKGFYEFSYPQGLSRDDFPFLVRPEWKVRDFEWSDYRFVVELLNGEAEETDLDPFQTIKRAGEICFACNPGRSGVNAFEVLLTECLGADEAAKERPALILDSMLEESIIRAFDAPSTTANPQFLEWSKHGWAMAFFHFNFNVNSKALFGECLRKVGVDTSDFTLTYNCLELLYRLRKQRPVSECQDVTPLADLTGTGRYQIQLRKIGLLAYQDRVAVITDRGHEFLNMLHPDCEDPELPDWLAFLQSDWPYSTGKMMRYLDAFFRNQLEYKPAAR